MTHLLVNRESCSNQKVDRQADLRYLQQLRERKRGIRTIRQNRDQNSKELTVRERELSINYINKCKTWSR